MFYIKNIILSQKKYQLSKTNYLLENFCCLLGLAYDTHF
jgi:hypothetical protein